MTTIVRLIREICEKFPQFARALNFFESIPPSTNEHELRNQRISTRLFLFFLIISLFILFLYNSLITITQTSAIPNPTYEQYLQHYSLYSQTLSCPCKNILIDYETFLHIDYTLHQICTSIYVTQQWIQYITNYFQSEIFFASDFRYSSANLFQALSAFCQLVNKTISDNLVTFSLNQYVSTTVTSLDLFESQIKVFIDQFKSSMTNTFILSLDTIRRTTQSNALYSALATNYQLVIPFYSSVAKAKSYTYYNCSCAISAKCIKPFPIYNYPSNIPVYEVPGMFRGCYTIEALLQSNLQCFYNQNCLTQLQSYFTSSSTSMNMTSLDASLSSHYSINSTIQQLLDQLMIEEWNTSIKHEKYYNECQPKECSYIHETKNNIIYIITSLIGLTGGLITIWRLIIPRVVTFLTRKKQPTRIENGETL